MSPQDKPESKLSPEDQKLRLELSRLTEALKVLADKMGGDTPLDRAIAFLTVATHTVEHGYIDQNDMAEKTGMPRATASRNVGVLSDLGDRGKEGLGVVDVRFDPQDRRLRRVSTNHKGGNLAAKVVSVAFPAPKKEK